MKTQDVEKLRASITETKRRIVRLKAGSFPAPLHIVTARIDAWLGDLKATGSRILADAAEGALTDGRVGPIFTPQNVEAIFIALHEDALRKRLHAEAAAASAEAGETVDPAIAPALIEKLEAELLELERRDFEAAEKLEIPQRADMDARVLLGIA